MKKNSAILLLAFMLSYCKPDRKLLHFNDFVELNKLEQVEVSNIHGTFLLNNKQLEEFKNEISASSYVPNLVAKVGAINIKMTIDGNTVFLCSSNKGEYFEADIDKISRNKKGLKNKEELFFKTNGINFNNFSPD